MIKIRVKKTHELYNAIIAILESWLNSRDIKFDCDIVKEVYYDNEEYDVVLYKIHCVDKTQMEDIIEEFDPIVHVSW